MGSKTLGFVAAVLLGLTMLSSVGCVGLAGPNLGVFGVPIPISPYWMDKKEDEYWVKERYDRVPILGPLTSGGPVVALDPPSDDEIMRALERAHPVEGGLPLLHEVQRSNVRIVKTKIADYVDPPRFYPLDRSGATAPRPLQVHDLLHADYPHRLAGSTHAQGRRCTRSHLRRPQPLPHGGQRGHGRPKSILKPDRCQRG